MRKTAWEELHHGAKVQSQVQRIAVIAAPLPIEWPQAREQQTRRRSTRQVERRADLERSAA